MNTQSIRYFTTAARLENLTKAAELLHTTQSSVSKSILNLEKELGITLFERNGKKLILNESGKRFLKSCDRILQETETVCKELRQMQAGGDNVIRISVAGTEPVFSECMAAFLRSYSNTEYRVDSFFPESELPDINQYDVIIYPDEDRFRKYKGYDFYHQKYLLAVQKNSPLAERVSLPTRMLNDQPFVFFRSKGETEYPFHVCQAQNIQMTSIHYVDSRELHIQMIAQGMGIGFLPEEIAGLYRKESRISLLHLTDHRFSRRMLVCFKRDKHLSVLASAFKDHMIAYFHLTESKDFLSG